MATIIKPSQTIALSAKETNTLFYEPIFMEMYQSDIFKIMLNVKNTAKFGFIRPLERILQAKTGCGFTPIGSMSVYDREVQVYPFKINVELCVDVFKDTILDNLMNRGLRMNDLTGTVLLQITLDVLKSAAVKDIYNLVWFGNRASTDTAMNFVDGLWSVHIPQLIANNLVPVFDTNSGVALTAGDGLAYIEGVVKNSDILLGMLPKASKRIHVTGKIWDQYETDLIALGGGDAGRTQLIDGSTVLTYKGIPVIPNWSWDEYDENVLGLQNEHRILFTVKENLVIATDILGTETSFLTWYDEKEEMNYIKSVGDLGTNYVHPKLMSIGL